MARGGRTTATAFAPASVGNVAVGFDVLGHALPVVGDRVKARRTSEHGVRIACVDGVGNVPVDVERNTAGVATQALLRQARADFGVELTIEKGIPLGSGLGGSAASAVAAVVATNALLEAPLPKLHLLKLAMKGEALASGGMHADNVAASLYGGLVLTMGIESPSVSWIPVPDTVRCVVVRPHMELSTREARRMLAPSVDLARVVGQTANLAGLVVGCFTGDLALIARSLDDVLIEPQRCQLIPGFAAVKRAAMKSGALGCSISGAGPAIFAWCAARDSERIGAAMVSAFKAHQLASDCWISGLGRVGSRIIE